MSDSLQPHGLQHTRFPCPSATPRVCWRRLLTSCYKYINNCPSICLNLFQYISLDSYYFIFWQNLCFHRDSCSWLNCNAPDPISSLFSRVGTWPHCKEIQWELSLIFTFKSTVISNSPYSLIPLSRWTFLETIWYVDVHWDVLTGKHCWVIPFKMDL